MKLPNPHKEGFTREVITTIELNVFKVYSAIREKVHWRQKLKNQEIILKWKDDAAAQGVREEEFNFALEWCKNTADSPLDPIELSVYEFIYESKTLLHQSLMDKFKNQVDSIENSIADEKKDWHPGSNNQVLDLLHPSLYCLIHGTTLKSSRKSRSLFDWIGKGEVVPIKVTKNNSHEGNHQWIPTNVEISKNGKAKFMSYINNLHPEDHKDLYGTLEEILEYFLTMFERLLSGYNNDKKLNIHEELPLNWADESFYCPEEDFQRQYGFTESQKDTFEYEDQYQEYCYEIGRTRDVPMPKMLPFDPSQFRKPSTSVSLKNKTIQIITKIAAIHLSPENPHYPGGSWHLEGMKNEQIVATGIYYYDCENITESTLSFRHCFDAYFDYSQDDDRGVKAWYGLDRNYALNQVLGTVVTTTDKCIVFPNIYQHRVEPFSLKDKTKKGYRKILAFFLVDPRNPILSTSEIAPQQREWIMRELSKDENCQQLPVEVLSKICDFIGGSYTFEEACKKRLELMKERKNVEIELDSGFTETFDLCEH